MKLDLLTNVTVVKDAMKFLSEHGKTNDKIKDSELLHNAASIGDVVTTKFFE